jgi:hypothetical protein
MWIPTCIASGWFLFSFGLIDLAIAISLAIAAAWQGYSLPHQKSQCTDIVRTHGQNSTAPSLFIVTGAKNSTFLDWRDDCKGTVEVWQVEIAVSYVLIGELFPGID